MKFRYTIITKNKLNGECNKMPRKKTPLHEVFGNEEGVILLQMNTLLIC